MGDNRLEYRLRSLNVGPLMESPEGHYPWGIRLSPRLELHLNNGFFAELRVEGGVAHEDRTPIGMNFFNSNPSSTLDERGPLVWRHVPDDRNDHWRYVGGLRNLVFGWRFNSRFSTRVGRFRFDQTEYERLFNPDHAWSQAINFARVNMRLNWIGAELRYDHQQNSGMLRRTLLSANITDNADGTVLSMSQGLLTFALNNESHPPLLTFTGYVAYRTVAQEKDELDPGHVLGAGGGMVYDYRDWSAGLAMTTSTHSYTSAARVASFQTRQAASGFVDFHPGHWRFRGLVSYLTRIEQEGENPHDAPTGMNEWNGEFAVGYTFLGGLTPALIYRFVENNDRNYSAHILAIGLNTSFTGAWNW